ncbi:hypothetical protein ACU686_23190 [Yinghuangia aomiensis]
MAKDLKLAVTDPVARPSRCPRPRRAALRVGRGAQHGVRRLAEGDQRGPEGVPRPRRSVPGRSWWRRGRGAARRFDRNHVQLRSGRRFLDKLVVKTVADEQQQLSTVSTGGADLLLGSALPGAEVARDAAGVSRRVDRAARAATSSSSTPPARRSTSVRARQAFAAARWAAANWSRRSTATARRARPGCSRRTPYADPAAAQPGPDRARAQALLDELAAAGSRWRSRSPR